MTLRDYRSTDLRTLSSIEQQCFPPEIAASPEALHRMLQTDAHAIVAETPEGDIAGFAVYRKVNRVTGSLATLDVLPQYRRQGIGSQLVSASIERLKLLGVEKLQLRVGIDNLAAQALYDRLGFIRLRADRAFYPDGSDGFVFETPHWTRSWSPAAVWTRFREQLRHYRVTGKLGRS